MTMNKRCTCRLCLTIRRINRIAKKLPKADSEWLIKYFGVNFDRDAEIEMILASDLTPAQKVGQMEGLT